MTRFETGLRAWSAPMFAYWNSADHAPIRSMLSEWRSKFPEFCVIGDPDVEPLLDIYIPGFVDIYRAIQIPAAKSDIARLVSLYEHGGLYVDCHYGLVDPRGVRRLVTSLERFEVIFVNRSAPPRERGTYWLINGVMIARPKHPLFLELANLAAENLRRQRQIELDQGFTRYNISALSGAVILHDTICEPDHHPEVVRARLQDRILIVPEEGLPMQRDRWRTYTVDGQQWHKRQNVEPLFLPERNQVSR